MDVSQACKIADIICMLVPDMQQGKIYKSDVDPLFQKAKFYVFLMMLLFIGNGLCHHLI